MAKKINTALATAGAQQQVKVAAQWLERLRDTPAQAGLALDARRRNIRDAFGVTAQCEAALAAAPHLKIALLDDVMTTGATLSEAARVLKMAGANSVTAITIARVPPPRAKLQAQAGNDGNLIAETPT